MTNESNAMKSKASFFSILCLSTIILSGCNAEITESDASSSLFKNIDKDIYGIVTSKSTSKNHDYRLIIEQVDVDFHDLKGFSDSKITLSGEISINETIVKNNDISMTFEARAYLDKQTMSVKLTDSKLIGLDLSNTYSAYYSDFEESLKSNINETVREQISSKPIFSVSLSENKKNFSVQMQNSNDKLAIEAKPKNESHSGKKSVQ